MNSVLAIRKPEAQELEARGTEEQKASSSIYSIGWCGKMFWYDTSKKQHRHMIMAAYKPDAKKLLQILKQADCHPGKFYFM